MTAAKKTNTVGTLSHVARFLQKPWPEKANSLKRRWDGFLVRMAVPVRLSFGAWWILRHDNLGEPLLAGTFEKEELAFVERFLQPGMTVLDLGAHHGLYTLLASKCVGPSGRVFSLSRPLAKEGRCACTLLLISVGTSGSRDWHWAAKKRKPRSMSCKAAKPAATASDRRRSQAQPPRFAFASRVSMHGYSGTASAVLISSSSTLKAQN